MIDKKIIEQAIAEDGKYVTITRGISMRPLFKEKRDTVILLPPNGRLKKYDVPLYRRGDEYVLHRVIKVLPDSYIIRGDNCVKKEYGISDKDIICVLDSFYRGEKFHTVRELSYRIYSAFIVFVHPLVWLRLKVKAYGRAILRRLHLVK